jgi:hypothetical protein
MTTPLETLIAGDTKLWLDSVDLDLVVANRQLGATGATPNPIGSDHPSLTTGFDYVPGSLCSLSLW